MKEIPVIITPRCILNRITDEDIRVMRQIFDDDLTRKFLPELKSLVSTNNGIQMMLSVFDNYLDQNEGAIWGIRVGVTLIGFVAFMDLSFNPTIFFATHPSYRMKGYMKESIVHTIRFILDHSFCKFIQTEVYTYNTTSLNLLKSIGFMSMKQDEEKTYLHLNSQ